MFEKGSQVQLVRCSGRTRGAISCVSAILLVVGLVACRSQPAPDTRPSWVQEAEARLQGEPTWKVSGSGVGSGSSSGEAPRSSFFGSAPRVTATGQSPASQTKSQPVSSPRSQPVAAPPGVQWGETRITVSVEE